MNTPENEQPLFRKEVVDKVSTPEQLEEYLRVTTPGIWIVLFAVLFVLIGLVAWSSVGTLTITEPAWVIVHDGTAQVVADDSDSIEKGLSLDVLGQKSTIALVKSDDYGRTIGVASVALPNGTYEASLVTDEVHPIEFLFESL